MPNVTEVNASAEVVLGVVKAPPLLIGGYDFDRLQAHGMSISEKVGNDCMRATGRIIANLVNPPKDSRNAPTYDNSSYLGSGGTLFRRVSYGQRVDGVPMIHDNLRFVIPLDSTSPFKLVQVKYNRARSDTECSPPAVGTRDDFDLELYYGHRLYNPDAKLEARRLEAGSYKLWLADGPTGELRELSLGDARPEADPVAIDPKVPGLVDEIVGTFHILETVSERPFAVTDQANLLLSQGYDNMPERPGSDPYDKILPGVVGAVRSFFRGDK